MTQFDEAGEHERDTPPGPGNTAARRSGIARGVAQGLSGEAVSAKGVLEAVGGVRGIVETVLPALVYLITFVVTQDVTVSVIAPIAVAIIMLVWRLVQRETLITSFSGILGVAVCVIATLVTGEGRGYFIPGFWINGAWITALTISMIAGWPLLGFVVGAIRGDFTAWRADKRIRNIAMLASAIWLGLFVARLAVQLPLFYAGDSALAALGTARLVMGTPLFGLVIVFTWLLFRNAATPEKDQQE